MTLKKPRLRALVAPAAFLFVSGCFFNPQLSVSPRAVDFGNSTTETVRLTNTGTGTLTWSVEEVTRANPDAPWVTEEIPWLTPETTAGQITTGVTPLRLDANTALLQVGQYNNVGLRFTSNGGDPFVLPISITVEATLSVNPPVVGLDPTATSGSFTVINTGTDQANWTIRFLPDADNPDNSLPLPDDFLVQPNPGVTPPGESTLVTASWDAGRDDFGLLVQSDAGSPVVEFRFGAALEGLSITPNPITVYFDGSASDGGSIDQVSSTLRLDNLGAVSRSWTLELVSRVNPGGAVPLSVTPSTGNTPAGARSEVAVKVLDDAQASEVATGSGNYDIIARSGDGFLIIPVIVELFSLPEIAISEPPSPTSTRPEILDLDLLDFGTEEIQQEFWIANIGPRDSQLFFEITHEDQGSEQPLIIDVTPLSGDTNGPDEDFFYPGENFLIDGQPVTVTVDRSAMEEDVETREITIRAVDAEGNVLDPVEPQTVTVRVARPPLKVEGQLNRSRPPYLLRFVFLLRDAIGQVIPTMTQDDRDRLTFTISEDDRPLDLDETEIYLEGPENLKTNLVLMLDYTGSMLNAGTQSTVDPRDQGDAIEVMKASALKFLDDLPPSYRVQIMYHFDRQQRDRLIHPFSTDRASLKEALSAFTLPPALSGVTTIRDALIDAIDDLAAEDSGDVLPFDEADVRAVVFLTDGLDNASVATETDVETAADDNRVRLYPVVYASGDQVNAAAMLTLAEGSGGHLYTAPQVSQLERLLANERGLTLSNSTITGDNLAVFRITNSGTTALNWEITPDPDAGWISNVVPNRGVTNPGASAVVTVQLNPGGEIADSLLQGALKIATTPDNGSGTVTIRAQLTGNTAMAEDIDITLDDPPGTIWNELRNQIVLTYITPSQVGNQYNIQVSYEVDDDTSITGEFEEDGVFFPGDILAGQLSLTTAGIETNPSAADPADRFRAEVFLRADYSPRDVSKFKVRFFTLVPEDVPAGAEAALAQSNLTVELATDGLLVDEDPFAPTWRLLSEGDGVYRMLTEEDNPLPYGAFGDLLKLTFTNLGPFVALFDGTARDPEFLVEMRADNDIYFSPASGGSPSQTKYFLYPAGPTNPARRLSVSIESDLAAPSRTVADLADPGIDPEAPFAWNRDEDALSDFNDPFPDDEDLPGTLVFPNPFEIESDVDTFTLTLTNDRLDTFGWAIDPDSVPPWISGITYGAGGLPEGQRNTPLAPGESETINFTVDRTGLGDGFYQAALLLESDVFVTEEIRLTLVVVSK
jgi:hypothetical protein